MSSQPNAEPHEAGALLNPVHLELRLAASGHDAELSRATPDVEDPGRASLLKDCCRPSSNRNRGPVLARALANVAREMPIELCVLGKEARGEAHVRRVD